MSDESQYKECDFCKNDIPILNFSLHEATCRRHHYKCTKCDEFVSLSGREEHEQMNHSIEKCEKCGTSYKPVDEATHLSMCRFTIESCEFCESKVVRKDFIEHRNACGARTEKCENCGRYVMLKDTATHICQPPQNNFTERIGTMISSENFYPNLPFSDMPYAMPPQSHFTDTITPTPLEPVPPNATHSPFEPPKFVSLSSLEARLDDESNSTEIQSEYGTTASAPCEFCGNQVPLSAIHGHQENCKFRGYVTGTETKFCLNCKQMIPELELENHKIICKPQTKEKFNQSIGSHYSPRSKLEPKLEPIPLHSSSLIPCEFCEQMVDFSEIQTHQLICPNRNIRMEFGQIPPPSFPLDTKKKCDFCYRYFENFEIANHQNTCVLRPKTVTETNKKCDYCYRYFENFEISDHQNTCILRLKTVAEIKCQFCLRKYSLSQLENHQKVCSKNPKTFEKTACKWCLHPFDEDMISDHENTCTYHDVKGRRGIHDTELPFSDTKPNLKIERKKSETIDNKCPFCKFPKPAFDMENHLNICAKNPKFRGNPNSFDSSLTERKLLKTPSPDLGTGLGPIRTQAKIQEKAPKPETGINPFSRNQSDSRKYPSTDRTMDTISKESSKFVPKQEPLKSTRITTNYPSTDRTMDTISKESSKFAPKQEPFKSTRITTNYPNTNPYNLYSQTDPSPQQQQQQQQQSTYAHKQQQTDLIKSPISEFSKNTRLVQSPTKLFRGDHEEEFAFSELKTDEGNLRFVPSNQFKCELKPSIVPQTKPIKPTTINLPKNPLHEPHHLTPTQDTSYKFEFSPNLSPSTFIPNTNLPRSNYTDTNTSYKLEPTRKPPPGQTKFPRRTSPRSSEFEYSKTEKISDTNRLFTDHSPKDPRDREIMYPPRPKSNENYTRTSSSGTETIIEPPPLYSLPRKPPNTFSDKYKQTSNYKK